MCYNKNDYALAFDYSSHLGHRNHLNYDLKLKNKF